MWSAAGSRVPDDASEARLITRARDGDRDALGQLYRRHHVAAYTLALRICGQREQAHDIVQDSFLRAFERLASFRGEAPFAAWLKRIVANLSVESLRGGKARWTDGENLDDLEAEESDPSLRHDALGLLARLTAPARTVLVLYELEGYSHREIADMLGRSEVWSKTTLSRAKLRLSQWLDEMSAEDPRIDRYLRDLPRAAPDSTLEAQVIQRHLRRRRLRRTMPLALAAAVVLSLVSWQMLRPSLPSSTALGTLPRSEAWVELRALDRELQEGYLADLPSVELERLWQRRSEVILALDHPTGLRHEVRL